VKFVGVPLECELQLHRQVFLSAVGGCSGTLGGGGFGFVKVAA